MAVLFITHKYPPAVGGMEKQSYELIHRVERSLPCRKIIWTSRMIFPYFLFRGMAGQVRALNGDGPISLIHLNEGLMSLGLPSLRRASSAPVICTVHGLEVVFPNRQYQSLLVTRLKDLDGLIAVSRATRAECLARGVPADRIEVIPNGVDSELSRIPKDPSFITRLGGRIGIPLQRKRILFSSGRPVRRKGISWFIENVLPHLGRDTILLIAGAVSEYDWFFRQASRLLPSRLRLKMEILFGTESERSQQISAIRKQRLQEKAFLLGRVPFQDLVQLYKHCDLFVMPNIPVPGDMEGFGLTALEASASGALVLASDLEGIRDAVRGGENGMLLKPGSPGAWIEAIGRWLEAPPKLHQAAREFQQSTLRCFNWDEMSDRYVSAFRKFSGI